MYAVRLGANSSVSKVCHWFIQQVCQSITRTHLTLTYCRLNATTNQFQYDQCSQQINSYIIFFLPSCMLETMLSAFSIAADKDKTRRRRTSEAKLFQHQFLMLPVSGEGRAHGSDLCYGNTTMIGYRVHSLWARQHENQSAVTVRDRGRKCFTHGTPPRYYSKRAVKNFSLEHVLYSFCAQRFGNIFPNTFICQHVVGMISCWGF